MISIRPVFDPLFVPIKSGNTTIKLTSPMYGTVPTYSDFAKTFFSGNLGVGQPLLLASRLLPRKYYETDPAGLAKAIVTGWDKAPNSQIYLDNVSANKERARPSKTSIFPAWYEGIWHTLYSEAWDPSISISAQKKITKGVHEAADVLRQYAPDSGAYQNEVSNNYWLP